MEMGERGNKNDFHVSLHDREMWIVALFTEFGIMGRNLYLSNFVIFGDMTMHLLFLYKSVCHKKNNEHCKHKYSTWIS